MQSRKSQMSFIEENLGVLSLKKIAQRLGKPVKSLEITLYKKKGSSNTKIHTGMITAGELATILKVDRNTVIGWISRHGLKSTRRVTNSKKNFTFIDILDFWDWAIEHKEKIDFSKIEPDTLPPHPHWYDIERKKTNTVSNYKCWTNLEEKHLLNLINEGKTYDEIAMFLDRSVYSIQRKYGRLKKLFRTQS
ncbi:DNA-binding protein [Bacillus sp. CGMCC 1.16607]|uniref:DNA-binding protein n=1 Tax=Bacillus sp. CGMCC 1.16607 TaxID=3351842 RepID=UPI0036382B4C